ncbi:hypothetical protein ACFX5K_00870 [Rickettsiales bacterium LUAb2]
MTYQVKVYNSIKEIDQNKWDACFVNEVEDYNYLLALENSNIKGFSHLYYTIEENNQILLAIPAFTTFYSLKTTASGLLSKLIPAKLGFKLLCLSSCFSENCLLGIKAGLSLETELQLFNSLINFFMQDAKARKIKFLAIKDLPESMYDKFKHIINEYFTTCKSLPFAILPITANNIDEYLLESCSHTTRKEIRRKIKAAGNVVIERRQNIDDIIESIITIYKDTESRSEWHFGELTKEYFTLLLKHSPKAYCDVYMVNGELLAANLLLENGDILLDKFFCMSYQKGRQYNLYVLSWIHNVQYAIDNKIKIYQSGQTGYFNKLRFGSSITHNYISFFHKNLFINKILKLVAPKLMDFHLEEDLKKYNT